MQYQAESALNNTNWYLILIKTLAITFILTTNVALASPLNPNQNKNDLPAIGIIIDDLGNQYVHDKKAVLINGALSYSFLPHTPHAKELAELANHLDKDVLLHLPMQSAADDELGPGALTLDMSKNTFVTSFQRSLQSVPHAVGINNHMGSLLTQHPGHMSWLMQIINQYNDLFFVDSFTVKSSVAQQIATENWVPNMKRDVFLDHDRQTKAIKRQFQRLLQVARKNGIALAIAHPYPETLAVLEQMIPTLEKNGFRLISVSQLVKLHMRRFQTWRAFLSL